MEEPKIEPCPFCGFIPVSVIEVGQNQWCVECPTFNCIGTGPTESTHNQAIRTWNRWKEEIW